MKPIEPQSPRAVLPPVDEDGAPVGRPAGTIRVPVAAARPAAPASSQEPAPETGGLTGGIQSEPMRQAYRDLARGLQDTGKGAEADRTYQKLKC